jgi:prevent-host-death family protein
MEQIALKSVRGRLTELIAAGEPIEITNRGKVVATLVPAKEEKAKPKGSFTVVPATTHGFKVLTTESTAQQRQAARDALLNAMNRRK